MKTFCASLLLLLGSMLASFVNAGNSNIQDRYLKLDKTFIVIETKPGNTITIEKILNWHEPYVIKLRDSFYAIDLEKKIAKTLVCFEKTNLIGFSTQFGGKFYALCNDGKHISLLKSDNNAWVRVKLPQAIKQTRNVILLANEENLILLTEKSIYRHSNNRWRGVGIKEEPINDGCRRVYKLYQSKIFSSFSCGAERPSGLFSIDFLTGKRQEYNHGFISGFVLDKQRNLWASLGWRLWDHIHGGIIRFENKTWTDVVSVRGSGDKNEAKIEFKDVQAFNWPYIPVLFKGLDFSCDGALYVVAFYWYTNYGVIKEDADMDWEQNYMLLKYHNGKWENIGIVLKANEKTFPYNFRYELDVFNIYNGMAVFGFTGDSFTGDTGSKLVIVNLKSP